MHVPERHKTGAELAQNVSVYYCMVCGPVMREDWGYGSMTLHNAVPHPEHFTFDEEDNPQ
jgi:hypothetical protein